MGNRQRDSVLECGAPVPLSIERSKGMNLWKRPRQLLPLFGDAQSYIQLFKLGGGVPQIHS